MFLIRRIFSKKNEAPEGQLEVQRRDGSNPRSAKELLSQKVAEADSLEERVALWKSVVRKSSPSVIVELPDSSSEDEQLPQISGSAPESAGGSNTVVVWNGGLNSSDSSDLALSEVELSPQSRGGGGRVGIHCGGEPASTEASDNSVEVEEISGWQSASGSETESEITEEDEVPAPVIALRSLEEAFGISESASSSSLTSSDSEATESDDEPVVSLEDACGHDLEEVSEEQSEEASEEDTWDESEEDCTGQPYSSMANQPVSWRFSSASDFEEEPEEEDASFDQQSQWADSPGDLEPVKTPKHIRFHKETGLLMELSQEGRHKRFWHDEFSEDNEQEDFEQLFGLCSSRPRPKKLRKF